MTAYLANLIEVRDLNALYATFSDCRLNSIYSVGDSKGKYLLALTGF